MSTLEPDGIVGHDIPSNEGGEDKDGAVKVEKEGEPQLFPQVSAPSTIKHGFDHQ